MTSKLDPQKQESGTLEKFPDFPPRDDLQNSIYLDRPAHQAMLEAHLGSQDSTIVLGEIPVRQTPGRGGRIRIPDLLVAFNIDRPLAVEQNGYSIRDQGKPPDWVLEVASATTANQDVVNKRQDYAAFGISEYWRFDPTGGRRYDAPIAGDRLMNGAYQPVEIVAIGPDHLHGHSDVLNLDPCWDHGELRWFDPASQTHLLTFDQEREGRIAERQARIAAEARANTEREARAAAEARVRELEAELENRDQS